MAPLTPGHVRCLSVLSHNPQRPSDIARRACLTPEQVAGYLRVLSARGLAIQTKGGWIVDQRPEVDDAA